MDVLIDRRFMESLFGDEEDESLIKMERTLLIPFARKGMRVMRRGKIILLQFENINLSLKTLLQENLLY